MPLEEGQAFAGYTILRRLGSGGMGEIYLARRAGSWPGATGSVPWLRQQARRAYHPIRYR